MKKFVFIFLLVFVCSTLRAQVFDIPTTRVEKVAVKDTLFVIDILIEKKDIDLNMDTFYYWLRDGIIFKNQGGYSGCLLHGSLTKYLKSGDLIENGYYSYGLKEGIWKQWDDKGNLLVKTNWRNGLKEGKQITNVSDSIVVVARYRKGLLKNKKRIKKY